MTDRDRLASLRIGREAGRGLGVVEIVNLRERVGRTPEFRMVDDIGDLFAVDPDVAWAAKPLQKLLTRPCRPRIPPSPDETVTPPASSRQAAAA